VGPPPNQSSPPSPAHRLVTSRIDVFPIQDGRFALFDLPFSSHQLLRGVAIPTVPLFFCSHLFSATAFAGPSSVVGFFDQAYFAFVIFPTVQPSREALFFQISFSRRARGVSNCVDHPFALSIDCTFQADVDPFLPFGLWEPQLSAAFFDNVLTSPSGSLNAEPCKALLMGIEMSSDPPFALLPPFSSCRKSALAFHASRCSLLFSPCGLRLLQTPAWRYFCSSQRPPFGRFLFLVPWPPKVPTLNFRAVELAATQRDEAVLPTDQLPASLLLPSVIIE